MRESNISTNISEARNALEALIIIGSQTTFHPRKDWSISRVRPEVKNGLEVLYERGYITKPYKQKGLIRGTLTEDGKSIYKNLFEHFIAHQIDSSQNSLDFALGTESGY